MKSKTFFILSAIVLLLGVLAYFLFQGDSGTEGQNRIGKQLFADLPVEKIDTLKIISREGTVTVSMKTGRWAVVERSDFPADFSKISSLIERISNLKVGRDLDASESNLTELALHAPDQTGVPDKTRGVRVEIAGGGQTMIDFLVGRERMAEAGSGGHYVLPAGSKMIHLVDQDLKYLDKKPENWIQTQITDVGGMNVRQVICRDDSLTEKVVYTLTRPEKGQQPKLAGPAREQPINLPKVDQLFDGLSSFEMVDVARLSLKSGPPAEKRIEYYLYDGRIYTIQLVGPVEGFNDRYAIRMNVVYMAEEGNTTETVAAPAETGAPPPVQNADSPPETAAVEPAEVKRENDYFGQWEFRVSKWAFDSFATRLEDLLEKDEKKDS